MSILGNSITVGKEQKVFSSNQNLLINWYFGNPVAIKETWYLTENSTPYSDPMCHNQTPLNPSDINLSVAYPASEGVLFSVIKNSTYYFKKDSTVFLGQLINGREIIGGWIKKADIGAVKIENNYITNNIQRGAGLSLSNGMSQTLYSPLLSGYMYTMSAVVKDFQYGELSIGQKSIQVDNNEYQLVSSTFFVDNNNFSSFSITIPPEGKIYAVKLELGSTQTLAHNINGAIYLNEIPNYFDQLLLCKQNFKYYEEQKVIFNQNITNPNLLYNWFFGNPVNQRDQAFVRPNSNYYIYSETEATLVGKTEQYYSTVGFAQNYQYYTFFIGDTLYMASINDGGMGYYSTGYAIDGWKADGLELMIPRIVDEHYQKAIVLTGTKEHGNIHQIIENAEFLKGKTVTFSILTDQIMMSSSYLSLMYEDNSEIIKQARPLTNSIQLTATLSSTKKLSKAVIVASSGKGGVIVPIAAKLEIGNEQTLFHWENNKMVLNEIPNYQDQLLKCQRYLVKINRFDSFVCLHINTGTVQVSDATICLPCPMRSTPTILNPSAFNCQIYIAVYNKNSNMLRIRTDTPNMPWIECLTSTFLSAEI